ncbi:potassium transporter [Prosthecochloris sp. GSB1]|uniref:TrkH family potassium uptake protein n=1 Tax=Prosthecochloris sp. GSB1 TaxID=281093 RepID=UPI000B8D10E3|nr:TrkH family potassium uptake protein [Prosthecochloris sp. GSB1]ASQ89609.1 potassium transporter [Prosthecochloris sp. GSB1]
MNFRAISHVLGVLLVFIGSTMAAPLVCALIYGDGDAAAILVSLCITTGTGLPVWLKFRRHKDLTLRDGIFIVTVGWILVSSFSALPFMIHGAIPSFTDAFFEMMSGYTTTGATVLRDIESVPHGLLFWRSMTHLIGGMGFIMVTIIILPLLGIGGMQLYKVEADPGQVITGEKILPRVKQTAIWLWGIYLVLILIQSLLMWIVGMPLFDALCHAFGTVSTSGYSTKNSSIGYYQNPWIDWITIVFMFLGGMTFMMHYHILKKDWEPLRSNTELRWYVGFVVFFCAFVSFDLWKNGHYGGFSESVRHGSFQVISILTTTGFTTDNYELWPQAAQMLILIVCFIGASAGSTTSGIKVVHYEIISKYLYATGKKFLQPLAVVPVKINGRIAEQPIITLAVSYFIVNIFMVFAGSGIMSMIDDMDYFSSMSAVISALFNIGPGFGDVGPAHTFSDISPAGKWFLSFNMLTGRLEMFSVLVMFYPSFWKA